MSESFQRDLLRGSLELMVLSIIADESQYGYEIRKRLQQASGSQIDLSAGTLYPLLHRLEADGLISSRWEAATGRRRRWYAITAAGKKSLQQRASDWHRYAESMWELVGSFTAKSHPTLNKSNSIPG